MRRKVTQLHDVTINRKVTRERHTVDKDRRYVCDILRCMQANAYVEKERDDTRR